MQVNKQITATNYLIIYKKIVNMEIEKNFGVIDYTMLAVTMLVSIGIGVYHGIKGNKTVEDFAMGSRSMSPAPVALSLLATFLSANTILGNVTFLMSRAFVSI